MHAHIDNDNDGYGTFYNAYTITAHTRRLNRRKNNKTHTYERTHSHTHRRRRSDITDIHARIGRTALLSVATHTHAHNPTNDRMNEKESIFSQFAPLNHFASVRN